MSFPSNVCNFQTNGRNPLFSAIINHLYPLQRSLQGQTISEIIDNVEANHPGIWTSEQIENALNAGRKQGLFKIVSCVESSFFTYGFNPEAMRINPKNWKYLCPGDRVSFPSCCSGPYQGRGGNKKKGSYTTTCVTCFSPGFFSPNV